MTEKVPRFANVTIKATLQLHPLCGNNRAYVAPATLTWHQPYLHHAALAVVLGLHHEDLVTDTLAHVALTAAPHGTQHEPHDVPVRGLLEVLPRQIACRTTVSKIRFLQNGIAENVS